MSLDSTPTLDGYIAWIRSIMGVSSTILPDNSPYISTSYELANLIVNEYLEIVTPVLYTQAVYNLGGDTLVNIAQDTPPNTYWSSLRTSFQLNSFVPGLVNATNDEDTSAALITPLSLQNITLADLQNLKTPWGRQYLAIAQSTGTSWGVS